MEVFGFDLSGFDWASLLPFILIGFAAQMIDGALGMAFGVITNTLLVGVMGVPPPSPRSGCTWSNASPPPPRGSAIC